MADSGEGYKLKHRLVGIAVVFGVCVFLLPLLLSGRDHQTPAAVVPSASVAADDDQGFVSRIVPQATDSAPATPGTTVAEPPAADTAPPDPVDAPRTVADLAPPQEMPLATATVADTPASTGATTAKPDEPKVDAAKPAAVKPAAEPDVDRGWMVQVGLFANSANARHLQQTLKDKGFTANTESASTSNGTATRVWVGPFEQRVAAARARARISQEIGGKSFIRAYP